MSTHESNGRLISCDESGFTGPQLLDEHQPYFVYASHDLTEDEAASFVKELRQRYDLGGAELKSKELKRHNSWLRITESLCAATRGRSRVIVHDKKAALAGKFYEYFFEPVLAENSALFYGEDFQRYVMSTVYDLIVGSSSEYVELAEQMQKFMRTFDPRVAPNIFSNRKSHSVELDRILKFCRGYSGRIAEQTKHLQSKNSSTGKWTLDLTTTALFSLLFFGWGHNYSRLLLLCDSSDPLLAAADVFKSWVGRDQASSITDGKTLHEIRGNLIAPVKFGSSDAYPTIQVADLLAGMTLDAYARGATETKFAWEWVQRHLHPHSISFQPEFINPSNRRVKIGREILKELALRADVGADPLDNMTDFIRRVRLRFD